MQQNQNAPTFKPAREILFFNPGDRISETIAYSIAGQGDMHAIAQWLLDASANSLFKVPTLLKLHDQTSVSVDFPTTTIQRFKDRGVIMIDPDWEPGDDEDFNEAQPFATTEDEAKEKGARKWQQYLRKIVSTHINNCNKLRAAGSFPLEAQGFTKRAFKLLGMVDPATQSFDQYKLDSAKPGVEAIQSEEAKALAARMQATETMMEKILNLLSARNEIEADEAIEDQTSNVAKPKAGKGKNKAA